MPLHATLTHAEKVPRQAPPDEATAFRNDFFEKNPDLLPWDGLVDAIAEREMLQAIQAGEYKGGLVDGVHHLGHIAVKLQASGYKGGSREAVMEAFAKATRQGIARHQQPPPIVTQYYLDNVKRIAKRLIYLDSETPGYVRVRTNPFLRDAVTEKFKKMGFKKPLFQSAEQFNIDCFLSYQAAAESILHRVLLDGQKDDQGRIHCWDGGGRYMGWQGLAQLGDWTNKPNCDCVFMVYISKFFDRISDLLEPIKPVE
jgi:hypothetical protein